jgi:preprotein translocase subunit SecE
MTTIIWDLFAEPDGLLITAGSAIVAILVTFYLWRHPTVNRLAHEVAGELSKVTWPTKKEVYAATIVVIVTSFIAAVLLGIFDTAWSAFTDLIYKF